MTKTRLKQYLALCALAVAVILTTALTDRLGAVVEWAGRDADPAAVLTTADAPVDPRHIRWEPDASLERPLEPATRDAIGEAYLISLALLDGAIEVDGTEDLAVHLVGPALAAGVDRSDGGVRPHERDHRIRVLFYSADGQLIEIEDEAHRRLWIDPNTSFTRIEHAVAVLIQIDGVWHLRHRVVTDATTSPSTGPGSATATPSNQISTNQGANP
jgi:hypothetical protein